MHIIFEPGGQERAQDGQTRNRQNHSQRSQGVPPPSTGRDSRNREYYDGSPVHFKNPHHPGIPGDISRYL
jgi:hypothetical protein